MTQTWPYKIRHTADKISVLLNEKDAHAQWLQNGGEIKWKSSYVIFKSMITWKCVNENRFRWQLTNNQVLLYCEN
jgi:hypothetical protein